MTIYDIRHCETYGNKGGIMGGDFEVFLTIKGIDQAKSLGYRLKNENQDFSKYKFVSSPKVRSQHTLKIIMEILGVDKEIEIEPLIKTKYKGEFEGLLKEVIKEKYKKELEEREKDPWNWKYPGGGESFAEEYERVLKFLDKNNGVENMIFVAHEGVCAVVKEILSGTKKEDLIKIRKGLKYDQNYCYKYENGIVTRI